MRIDGELYVDNRIEHLRNKMYNPSPWYYCSREETEASSSRNCDPAEVLKKCDEDGFIAFYRDLDSSWYNKDKYPVDEFCDLIIIYSNGYGHYSVLKSGEIDMCFDTLGAMDKSGLNAYYKELHPEMYSTDIMHNFHKKIFTEAMFPLEYDVYSGKIPMDKCTLTNVTSKELIPYLISEGFIFDKNKVRNYLDQPGTSGSCR